MSDQKNPRVPFSLLKKLRLSRSVAGRAGILILLSVLLAALFPVGTPIELDYKIGGVWAQKDLIAPFSFPIHRDESDYLAEVAEAKSKVYPVFILSDTVPEDGIERLRDLFSVVDEILTVRANAGQRTGDSARLSSLLSTLEVPFSGKEWEMLARLKNEERLTPLRERIGWIGKKCWAVGVLDRPRTTVHSEEIAARSGTEETVLRLSVLYDPEEVLNVLDADLQATYREERDVVNLGNRIGAMYIQPNLLFDRTASDQAIKASVEAVPRTIGYVQENERIVSKHERITKETHLKLESFRKARADRRGDENLSAQFLGIFLHVGSVVALYGIYLGLFRKKIFGSARKLILIALLIFVEGLFAYLTRELEVDLPLEYLIAVPVASMLLAILFDSRVAFYGTVIIALLVAAVRGNDYSIALASVIAGALSVYTVRDIRNRTQIFRSMGFIFLGYAVTIVALALERFARPELYLTQLSFAAINALVSPVLTYGLLIFFERVFRMTTDLTLIELSHLNHPLLRQLSEKAPGTYHHSMAIAGLAEAAAVSVGASDILVRVGAYFHDVGKIGKPAFFVENQRTSRSRHDRLPPRVSAQIIRGHVENGIALAQDHGLPQEVVDCIPMHHGTTRIEYFYDKAMKQAEIGMEGKIPEEVREEDYRYPGPKPQTKETGILMLADTTEARVRSLDDHSPQALRDAIDSIVSRRFEEGELDECPLTLKDLTRIKDAFHRVLVGVYHTRVKYPEERKGRTRKHSV